MYKGKSPKPDPGKYRPISLASFLSKVFERLAKRQLEEFLESQHYFSNCRFGFRGARSTELALPHAWHDIVMAAEGGQCCLAAFLDVSKAFDCLNITYFIGMLERLGCSPRTVSWFRSYLGGRTQSVRVGQVGPTARVWRTGAPQGSVLEPFMFIIYLNFVLRAIERDVGCRSVCYADDTTLLFRVSASIEQVELEHVGKGVGRASDHSNRFGLVVNSSKTALVLSRKSQKELITDKLRVEVHGESLSLVPPTRCLGVVLDENMKRRLRISSISGKCDAVIASLARLRKTGACTGLLVRVYRGLFEPVLTYGVTLWGSYSERASSAK